MSDVWESEPPQGTGFLTWFAGGLGALVVGLFVIVGLICCGCTFSWGSFVRFGIGEDLQDFRIGIRGSDLTDAEKESYVRRLERVEDRLDAGDLDMSFAEWVGVSSDMEDVLADRSVEAYEKPILEEAMRGMER